ncbi:23S rRNA (cytosine(2499)-C(5))-methyltransferase [Haloferula helveola]|uniref:23S rRNA (Cytosine(2499)-C(5))-methyltransferase n=1 Tax=Haloferula helveola TaxID=490095 RepID=A0ABM7RKT6_9BACT|nr:23S rRNA (cytosine(2499)-C(5))-methyltransferase [Haloferula helveola]
MRMQLLPRAETAVRKGHPWVFAESVKSQNREGSAGELVVMYDRRDRFLAVGLYDPDSPIRVRVVHAGSPAVIDRDWWLGRARDAATRREEVFNAKTNGARCINGESEGFPGLVADRYADTLVVKLYSAVWLERWAEIESVLREVFGPRYLVLRVSRNLADATAEHGLVPGFQGDQGDEVVVFSENGIRFEAAVVHGQKTGFFLDQRDNRARVEQLAEGREVLNLFSFSGGFSLYAARGGATRVVDVDISAHALESARRNFALNPDLDPTIHEGIQADVFEWVGQSGASYDLVISDPPSLAKRERDREKAIVAYRRLNGVALARVRQGGILVAASCSAHVSADEFFGAVRSEAKRSGRRCEELWTSRHADDHPASFPEAEYLKAICLKCAD